MWLRLLMLINIFFFITHTYADVCPSITDIKRHQLKDWLAYDSDEEIKINPARFRDFQHSVKEFALAEWTNNGKKNSSIHCYYRDQYGSNLDIYRECAASMEHCRFHSLRPDKKLARKNYST
jgi:hypothetical protein